MKISGSANQQHFDISGSGDIHAFGLPGKSANVDITGSGNCEVNVSDQLNVEISGSGNVYYLGNPSITTDITGSGNVISK